MNRAYIARAQYPGKKQFYLGTVVADPRAKDHELQPLFAQLWAEISPHPMPSLVIVPGYMFVKEDV